MGCAAWVVAKEGVDDVRSSGTNEAALDEGAFVGFVPKEETALGFFFVASASHKDGFHRVWVHAAVVHFGGKGHGGGGEVLYLLEVKVELLGGDCQLCHVDRFATGVARYEIWYDLLFEIFATVDGIEQGVKATEERK